MTLPRLEPALPFCDLVGRGLDVDVGHFLVTRQDYRLGSALILTTRRQQFHAASCN